MPGADRRAARPPGRATVRPVPAGPGPAHGRGGARLVPAAYPDGDFDLARAEGAEADLAAFARECELARAAAAGHSLDETFVLAVRGTTMDLRWIYLHMIEEYARHNGHADILREQIDGVTGD